MNQLVEKAVDIMICEDTIDTAIGDDNLLAILRVDGKGETHYWEVTVVNTDTNKTYSKLKFYNIEDAQKEFDKTVKEF